MSDSPLIPFPEGCVRARFKGRYKRFTVVCERHGQEVLAHTNNTGSMLGLLRPGSEVLLSPAANPARKLPFTWELASFHGQWVGINTGTPNRLLRRAWEQARLPEAAGYERFEPERRIGGSRLDARLEGPAGELWVECKNVTLVEDGAAQFPDAVSVRALKHLHELMALKRSGARVAVFYLVQRTDGACFAPAEVVDPDYAALFYRAMDAGVEMWPYVARVSEAGVDMGHRLPVLGR